MSDFGKATLAQQVDEHTWEAEVADGWDIGGRPNGGYLLALAGQIALGVTNRPHPLAVSGHFLRPPTAGPVRARTRLLRDGKNTSVASVDLVQRSDSQISCSPTDGSPTDGSPADKSAAATGAAPASDAAASDAEPFLSVLATTGTLSTGTAPHHQRGEPPALPPPDACPSSFDLPRQQRVGLLDHVEIRMDPATIGWALGTPSGEARMQGWLRFVDGADPDPTALLLAVDALPPTLFELGVFGWVPTMQLAVVVRGAPAPGWLRLVVRSQLVDGGFVDEDAEVWDSADRLVAQSRQLAGVRLPPSA